MGKCIRAATEIVFIGFLCATCIPSTRHAWLILADTSQPHIDVTRGLKHIEQTRDVNLLHLVTTASMNILLLDSQESLVPLESFHRVRQPPLLDPVHPIYV